MGLSRSSQKNQKWFKLLRMIEILSASFSSIKHSFSFFYDISFTIDFNVSAT